MLGYGGFGGGTGDAGCLILVELDEIGAGPVGNG
jgi:hypothetical protein